VFGFKFSHDKRLHCGCLKSKQMAGWEARFFAAEEDVWQLEL
jgi:hypothetical protein